jgi:uncharacterized protein YndB with AHSA1/START domain
MNVLKKVAIAIGATLILLLVIGFLLPAHVHIERSTTIAAPPEQIYEYVGTLKHWPDWTAWNTKSYPDMKWQFEGPESGVGAISQWQDKSTGNGKMNVTAADPAKGIEYTLKFNEDAPTPGSIKFATADKETKVTWSFDCEVGMNPIGRYFCFFFMDGLIGKDFEEGLTNLKKKVETESLPGNEVTPGEKPAEIPAEAKPAEAQPAK